MRVSELCGLCWQDLQPNSDGGQVTVLGKGGVTRAVKIQASVWKLVSGLKDAKAEPGDPVFADMPIYCQEDMDGVKFYLDNPEAATKPNAAETWLLLRASGTEPLMRIYTESCSKESVTKLLDSARAFALGG